MFPDVKLANSDHNHYKTREKRQKDKIDPFSQGHHPPPNPNPNTPPLGSPRPDPI